MVRNDVDSTLVYPFYCGRFDGSGTLNNVIWLSNANNWSNNPLNGFSFPLSYLQKNIKDIYSITEKEHNIFKNCKSKKDLDKLLDNLYIF